MTPLGIQQRLMGGAAEVGRSCQPDRYSGGQDALDVVRLARDDSLRSWAQVGGRAVGE